MARASELSVSPVRAELRAGALSETITLTNRGGAPLRVAVKVMEWTQDADGKDIYQDTGELVYFPRQAEIEPDARRLIRVGARVPGGAVERAYRMYIEEQPPPGAANGPAQVAVYFRFGVPVFVTPAVARRQPEFSEPRLEQGRVSLQVKNAGNQHFRLVRIVVRTEHGFSREVPGWYSLAGSQRTYTVDIPREACRKAGTLTVAIEGDGLREERKLHVDPARCS
jgi:fimbrial chaperone protein